MLNLQGKFVVEDCFLWGAVLEKCKNIFWAEIFGFSGKLRIRRQRILAERCKRLWTVRGGRCQKAFVVMVYQNPNGIFDSSTLGRRLKGYQGGSMGVPFPPEATDPWRTKIH